jgi:hypothetical protein
MPTGAKNEHRRLVMTNAELCEKLKQLADEAWGIAEAQRRQVLDSDTEYRVRINRWLALSDAHRALTLMVQADERSKAECPVADDQGLYHGCCRWCNANLCANCGYCHNTQCKEGHTAAPFACAAEEEYI